MDYCQDHACEYIGDECPFCRAENVTNDLGGGTHVEDEGLRECHCPCECRCPCGCCCTCTDGEFLSGYLAGAFVASLLAVAECQEDDSLV